MSVNRRNLLAATAGVAAASLCRPALAETKKFRFAVGPLLPNPEDTKKAFGPVFAYLAKELGVDFDLSEPPRLLPNGGGQEPAASRRRPHPDLCGSAFSRQFGNIM
jgi:hypothetical protein